MLGHCSRFPPLSVSLSLIRRTLEFQHIKDLVGEIEHDRIRSPSPKMTSLYGSVSSRSTPWSFSCSPPLCPSFAAFRLPLPKAISLSASSAISSHGKTLPMFRFSPQCLCRLREFEVMFRPPLGDGTGNNCCEPQ